MLPLRRVLLGRAVFAVVMAMAACLLSNAAALAAGDVNRESCSNAFPGVEASPGFRAFLPDCRAYELVTSPYESGQPAFGVGRGLPPMSASGEHLLSVDFAGFAGAENEEQNGFEYGAIYEFSRTPSGWATEALEPPASQYARRNFVAGSADLSRTLWELVIQPKEGEEVGVPREDGYTYAVREAVAGGRAHFTAMGPVVSPEHENAGEGSAEGGFGFVGASRDLSHIVVSVKSERKQLWPGDGTSAGDLSLYEYVVGSGEAEPVLVGVKKVGPLEGATHLNEHAELESECGTVLGSRGEGSTYNAVSKSGAVVYFTAQHTEGCSGAQPAVDELYARIDGERTMNISEPTTGPQGNCEICNESEPKAAVFEGASEDGSEVFFLSEQQLLSGARGDNLYEYDFNAAETNNRVTLIAADVPGVARISQDGTRVYYESTDKSAGSAEEGGYNLYVYDTETGRTAFVATLMTKTEAEGLEREEIEERTGVTRLDRRRPYETTPDGRFLVFVNARHLTGGEDTSTVRQVFEYDAQTESLVRVSTGQKSVAFPAGYGDNGNTTNSEDAPRVLKTPDYHLQTLPTDASSDLSLSEDGAVFFTSADPLTPQSVAGRENVYEYREGNVYLISPGDEAVPLELPDGTRLLGTDELGGDVFFSSTDSLVPQDTDTQASWYDARTGGGFPAPPSPVGCLEDACRGPLKPTPSLPFAGGSETAPGGGNLASPAPKPAVKLKSLSRAQKLAKALEKCKKQPMKKRKACVRQAEKRYGRTVNVIKRK